MLSNIIDGNAVHLGIPAFASCDPAASRDDRAAEQSHALLAEYRQARGYFYEWGHIIEQHRVAEGILDGTLVWHVVPTALWHAAGALRPGGLAVMEELGPMLRDSVRASVRGKLPDWLLLGGCYTNTRKRHHAIFSLISYNGEREVDARAWMHEVFLPTLLPEVLGALHGVLSTHVGDAARSARQVA